jgi:chromosome segregation ATPase
VEESLMQVTSGADKVLRGKEKEVMRKMKENSELVYELNVMRKKENDFSKERRDLNNENARLKRELNETMRTTTRSQTATGFTRRIVASRESREKSLMLDIHDLERSKAEVKSGRVDRNRLVSARRTLLVQDEKKQKQSKIFDIARELETARSTIKRQDRMIE